MMVFKSTFRKMSWNHRLLAISVLLVSMASAFAKGEGADLMCDPCIERPDYTVKVIVHGTTDDRFWTRVLLASEQAAKDMRIQLDFDLYGKLKHLVCHLPCYFNSFLIIAGSLSIQIRMCSILSSWLMIS